MEQEMKVCQSCNYQMDLTNEEFDVMICPKCNSQMEGLYVN